MIDNLIGGLYEEDCNFSGAITITDESEYDIVKEDNISSDGKSSTEMDDEPLSDCSWNMRTNNTKKNKKCFFANFCGSDFN